MLPNKHLMLLPFVLGATTPAVSVAQPQRTLLPIEFEHSAEFGWLKKPIRATRTLDDMTRPESWRFTGTGTLTVPTALRLGGMRVLRVDMQMFSDAPAPTRTRLSSINLRRPFEDEDWRVCNRLSMWIKPEVSGFPMLPLQIALHNEGAEKVPDRYGREGIHYVTLAKSGWQQVVWEIEPLARDRITAIEIGYWVNKMLAAPSDRVAVEIGRLEVSVTPPSKTEVQIRLTTSDPAVKTLALRAENLIVDRPVRSVVRRAGSPTTIEWKARSVGNAPWVAVVIFDSDVTRRREVIEPRQR